MAKIDKKMKRQQAREDKKARKELSEYGKKSKIAPWARKFFGAIALAYVLTGVMDSATPVKHEPTKADLATAGWVIEPDKDDKNSKAQMWYDTLDDEPEPEAEKESDDPTFSVGGVASDEPEQKPEPKKAAKAEKAKDARKANLMNYFDAEIESAQATDDKWASHWALDEIDELEVGKALKTGANADISDADKDEIRKHVKEGVKKAQSKVSQEEREAALWERFDRENGLEKPSDEVFPFGTVEEPEFESETVFGDVNEIEEDAPLFDVGNAGEATAEEEEIEEFDVGDAGANEAKKNALINHFIEEIKSTDVGGADNVFAQLDAYEAINDEVDAALGMSANAGLDDNAKHEIKERIKAEVYHAQMMIGAEPSIEK